MHPAHEKKKSFAKGPDYSGKKDTLAYLKGEKQTPTEADYKPASVNSKNRCHECKFYDNYGKPESSCQKVVGIVKAEGICDLFAQREYPNPDFKHPDNKPPMSEGPKKQALNLHIQVTHGV